MRPVVGFVLLCAISVFSVACSQSQERQAHEKAAAAREKAREEAERLKADARKLGHEAQQEARNLGHRMNDAANNRTPASDSTTGPREKIRQGSEELRTESGKAAVKLDHAAMIAKIKARLAADVGISTITNIDVDSSGQIVTLRGTVSSEEQKQQAEESVRQVPGVTKVVDDLRIKP